VLWKNDGNCCGFTTYLYLQRVSDDGLTLQGEPAQLLTNDQAWEGRLVEAPTLWKQDGRYYLFYSANDYSGLNYAIGVASADQITGPYRKSAKPLMSSDLKTGGAFGPGGQDVVLDDDQEPWLVYHSWDTMVAYRRVQIDELEWQDGMPMVKGPDRGPQPRP
jgi:beta-xylosidase